MTRTLLAVAALAFCSSAFALDPQYTAWDAFLRAHVRYVRNGNASRVDYAGAAKDHAALTRVLNEYEKVTRPEFDRWTKPQQETFLINAYNAFTVEKVLTRYPDLRSIRDFGSVFENPWKDKFFTLFGEPFYLDRIEQEMLRKDGVYDDPRIHVALVCASIGCPMLRAEAYRADMLDRQLDDALRRFLSDRTRNRYDAASRTLRVSKIFNWYGKDFAKGHKGFTSLPQTFARYAEAVSDDPDDRAIIKAQRAPITFLDYDWSLNDVSR